MTSAPIRISSLGPCFPPSKLSLLTCAALLLFSHGAWAQQNPQYGSMEACRAMQVGSPTYGPYGGDLKGFVPFQKESMWNTKIVDAPVDPRSAQLTAVWAAAGGYRLHANFGASPADGGIPYIVVDSRHIPSVPIHVIDYATESDVVKAPYPGGDFVPIEGDQADCSGWPDTYISDAHTLVLDRDKCWLYETFNTNRCNGEFNASNETIFDMTRNEFVSRPWGWTSADAGGLSLFAGLVRYDEAASGVINHAIRFTMSKIAGDSHGGYFVLPASHSASHRTTPNLLPIGTRIRLKANVDISSFSPINQAILTAMKTYGLILADIGSNFYVGGDTDPRWDDADLGALHSGPHAITSADFEVVQMTPSYPGMDSATAPTLYPGTGSAPVIDSFTASSTRVGRGAPVTFRFHITGSTYAYIDNIGPVRLHGDEGSVTITPGATQTYTLYALNTSAVNNATQSQPITVTVPHSFVAPPTITPPGGNYASDAPLSVTLNTVTAGDAAATYYYTTDGSMPTINSTKYIGTACSNAGPDCNNNPDAGSITPITITQSETLKAIAVVPGYAEPSAVSTAHFTIGNSEVTDTPIFSLAPGTYPGTQVVYLSDSTNGTDGNGNTIYYTTDGSTPTTSSQAFNNNNGCYGCVGSGPIIIKDSETIKAVAVAAGYADSAVATATYTIRHDRH